MVGIETGLGAAVGEELTRRGLQVVGVGRPASGHTAAAEEHAGASVTGDLADPETAATATELAARQGDLSVLVVASLHPLDRAFVSQDDREWDLVLDSLLTSSRTFCRGVAPAMQAAAAAEMEPGPLARPAPRRIVLTVPATTATATAGGSASAAAGGAVVALTRTLARELGGYGIRVNAVRVGHLEDEGAAAMATPVREMAAATTALGRFGTVQEAAAVYGFLASEGADYITGAVVDVTGGLLGT
ncbi:SDR family NAD(P)-dependent oxidoreductase [Euzebya tangerina]|uniref:SDR family NAD(P)-dependent oxidoreductase n=1 Tax=Euzebya tangerina TaxID=591198 RepID=UPI0013C358DF|nr:SDR family oxidoreductase [Euzebya tangerina]